MVIVRQLQLAIINSSGAVTLPVISRMVLCDVGKAEDVATDEGRRIPVARSHGAFSTAGSGNGSGCRIEGMTVELRNHPHGGEEQAADANLEMSQTPSTNWRRGLLVLALLTSLGGLAYAYLDNRQLRSELELSRSNVRILTQSQDQLFSVFMARVEDVEELTPSQKEFLDAWVRYDEQFSEINASNTALLFERAITGFRLGHAYILLGDPELGCTKLRDALDQLLRLIRQDPEMVSFRVEAVTVASSLAGTLGGMGDFDRSIATFQTAISLFMTSPNPISLDDASSVADLHERIADLRRQQHDLPGAMRSLEEAIAMRRTAWDFDQSDTERARRLVETCLTRIEIISESSDSAATRQAIEEATQLLTNLANRYPDEPSFAEDLARIRQRDQQSATDLQYTP